METRAPGTCTPQPTVDVPVLGSPPPNPTVDVPAPRSPLQTPVWTSLRLHPLPLGNGSGKPFISVRDLEEKKDGTCLFLALLATKPTLGEPL